MSYNERIELVRAGLVSHCRECISENWNKSFEMWLRYEADSEVGHCYQRKFKEQFVHYTDSEIEEVLWVGGKNIVFAVRAFLAYKKNAQLSEILEFTEKFIEEQIDDFENWCEWYE